MSHDSNFASPQAPSRNLIEDTQTRTWILIGVGTLLLFASYANSLYRIAMEWQQPEYSHGYLIPAFAAVLMWMRREPFEEEVPSSHRWWGVLLLLVGTAIRVYGTYTVRFTVDYISLIPSLMGVFVLVGGLRTLRWAGPPIAFLVFMLPLPGFLKDGLLRPLQTIATQFSVYAMQTLGVEVYRDGNVIHLEKMDMNVIDACSGLRMLTIFLALSVAIAMVYTARPWWERLIIVVSAIPVAVMVNVIRITITGVLYNLDVSPEVADFFFHKGAGLLMMPMAMVILFTELAILSRLIIETGPATVGPRSVGFVPRGPAPNG
jgi:exosortase